MITSLMSKDLLGVTEEQHKTAYAYKATFLDTEYGKEVLADLRQRFYERLSFEIDPNITAFYEGQRSVVIRLLKMIDMADPEKYPILKEETLTDDDSTSNSTGNYF